MTNESLLMEEYLFESVLKDDGKDRSNLYFHIRPRERQGYAHFHVFNKLNASPTEKKSKKYFECCILLKACGYWNHEPCHRKIPNEKMKKLILEFIYSSNAETRGKTVWEYCKDLWLSMYPDKDLKKMKNPPDYRNLPTGPGR